MRIVSSSLCIGLALAISTTIGCGSSDGSAPDDTSSESADVRSSMYKIVIASPSSGAHVSGELAIEGTARGFGDVAVYAPNGTLLAKATPSSNGAFTATVNTAKLAPGKTTFTLDAATTSGNPRSASTELDVVIASSKSTPVDAGTPPAADAGSTAHADAGATSPPVDAGSTSATTAPAQASAAGFTSLVFDDDFSSESTISPTGSGNYKWYPSAWYYSDILPTSGYSVSNGVLTINTDVSGYGDGLATAGPAVGSDTEAHTSAAWQHGYFEASIRFNPANPATTAWPAFWSWSIEHVTSPSTTNTYAELDFMEAYPNNTTSIDLITTVHQWVGNSTQQNANNSPSIPNAKGVDFTQFHKYGCLWTTDKVVWYFDDEPVTTVATGPGTTFTALEQEHMYVLLGTGKNWPMEVDYVNVWQ